jgi:hypothetical protein
MKRRTLFAFAIAGTVSGLITTAVPAAAQTAPTTRVRGVITGLDGAVLSVTTREGKPLKITLVEPVTVSAPKLVPLSEIGPNTYIGTAAMPGKDGVYVAQSVAIFPESARGAGDGHRDWDLTPGSTMTNANVTALVDSTDGRVLTLTFKTGTVKVRVPEGTPIMTTVPAGRADLKPGAHVFLGAMTAADCSLSVSRILVEKDGVVPPM